MAKYTVYDFFVLIVQYSVRVLCQVGPVLKQQKDLRGFYWMMNRTEDATALAAKKPRY